MNRRTLLQQMSCAAISVGATAFLPNCATTGGGTGSLPPATKENPFVNSLGMKFVPVPGTKILMCTTETTVAQYQAAGRGYQKPFFQQTADHPAVLVTRADGVSWCDWLSAKEGRMYRLPSDAEWSKAVGKPTYPWGSSWPPATPVENLAGQEHREGNWGVIAQKVGISHATLVAGYSDRHVYTAPVASYQPNNLGIYDLGGNVLEWILDKTEDVFSNGKPTNSGSNVVSRGGSWVVSGPNINKSSFRNVISKLDFGEDNTNHIFIGFRCVLS